MVLQMAARINYHSLSGRKYPNTIYLLLQPINAPKFISVLSLAVIMIVHSIIGRQPHFCRWNSVNFDIFTHHELQTSYCVSYVILSSIIV
jgi:hypothetical protein